VKLFSTFALDFTPSPLRLEGEVLSLPEEGEALSSDRVVTFHNPLRTFSLGGPGGEISSPASFSTRCAF